MSKLEKSRPDEFGDNVATLNERKTAYSQNDGPEIESGNWTAVRTYRDLEFAVKWLRECWAARAWSALDSRSDFWWMMEAQLDSMFYDSYSSSARCSGMMFGYGLLDEFIALAEEDPDGYRLFTAALPRYKKEFDERLALQQQFRANAATSST